MTNMGGFFYEITQYIINLTSTIYNILNIQINISFVSSVLSFFGSSAEVPTYISLLSVISTLGATGLLAIIIYNIFKP